MEFLRTLLEEVQPARLLQSPAWTLIKTKLDKETWHALLSVTGYLRQQEPTLQKNIAAANPDRSVWADEKRKFREALDLQEANIQQLILES